MIFYFIIDLLLSKFTTSISILIYILNIRNNKTTKILFISLIYDLIFTNIYFLHFIIFYLLDILYKKMKIKNIYYKFLIILFLYKVLLYLIFITYNYISFSIYSFFDGIILFFIINLLSYFISNCINLRRW
jgi:hypothetical protein